MLQSFLWFTAAPIVACLTLGSAAAMAETCSLNGKPVSLSDGATTAGQTGMVVCQNDGKLWRKLEYKNGKQIGYSYIVSYDGAEEFTTNANGNKNGPQKKFSKNGKLIMSCTYENGDRVGLFQDFFNDGKLRTYSWYEKGQSSPSMEIGYHNDGSLSSVRCGKKFFTDIDKEICGFGGMHTVTLVGDDGATEKKTFKNGVVSESTNNTKDGKMQVHSEFKNGLEHRKSFFDDGSLKADEVYKGRLKVSEASYYMNGNRKSEITYQDSPKKSTRMVQEFSNSGKLSHKGAELFKGSESYYDAGGEDDYRPIGPQEDYFDSGVLHQTQNFNDAGDLDGEQKSYNKNGILRELKTYERGVLKHGKFYDDSGKLKSEKQYFPDGSFKEISP